jgi:hypothetical protein
MSSPVKQRDFEIRFPESPMKKREKIAKKANLTQKKGKKW